MHTLPASFFIQSRSKLSALMMPGSLAIVASNRPAKRSEDQYYPFRQSSNLYYLTGITSPDVTLLLFPEGDSRHYHEILFIPEVSEREKLWEGTGLEAEEAKRISGIEDVQNYDAFENVLQKVLSACNYVYFGTPDFPGDIFKVSNEAYVRNKYTYLLNRKEEHDLRPLLTRLRMVKEPAEVDLIREAIRITGAAFSRVLQVLQPGVMEYDLLGTINCEFNRQGVFTHAFDPIIASGENALVLHYTRNSSRCEEGALLLLDFGAEWHYYAGDISRTIPVNGRFSSRQAEMYEAVLVVLNEVARLMKPGVRISDLNEATGKLLQEAHIQLGLYSRQEADEQAGNTPPWKRYFWHGVTHSMGLDVHDPFDKSMELRPGMLLTCEPGLYVPEDGTGIRLENDILITDGEPENLSLDIPIQIADIEELMRKA